MTDLPNVLSNDEAYLLGCIAASAGHDCRDDVGDSIDRGLILRRLLKEQGFTLQKSRVRTHSIKDLAPPVSDSYYPRLAYIVNNNDQARETLVKLGWEPPKIPGAEDE